MNFMTPRSRVEVVGARIDAVEMNTAVAQVIAWGAARESRTVCACNVHAVVQARSDPSLAKAIATSDLALPDGAPVAWFMRRNGAPAQRRVSGPDLMWAYLAAAAAEGQSPFLYGATEETLELLCARIRASFPGIVIAGVYAPPFRAQSDEEDRIIVERINASGAASVWVALGCPKQDVWIAAHRDRIHAVMVGVGAAFDFHAGTLRRAPLWMQRAGLEWLHRLVSEPRRLWRRYLVTNTTFVALVLGRMVASRLSNAAREIVSRSV
jgi:N-acetylglucosaminyldiphosphoundecaprenol N-acetyl-beta-D-mannosaminyltransferase